MAIFNVSVVPSNGGSGAGISVPVTDAYVYVGAFKWGKLAVVRSLLDGVDDYSVCIDTMAETMERLAAHLTSHTSVPVEVANPDSKPIVDVYVDAPDSVEEFSNAVGSAVRLWFL